jgi:4-cresol dehydrogenase (hydroxylating)
METEDVTTLLAQIEGVEIDFADHTLSRYASSITGSFIKPVCIIFPSSVQSVSEIVKLAHQHNLKLYPISKGKNLGYGDAQATSENQVILDLSRMNQIIRVDPELCYATIQPGVTQEQLFNFLRNGNYPLQLDVTGAGLEASIVGNVLERGFGHTDYGDRFSKVINMEVVLPSGEIIKTGYGDFVNSDAKNVYRYGFGPMLDGLFSQSNFGIITSLTLELMPVPEKTLMFVFSTSNPSDLKKIVTAVRELKLKGIVNSAIHIANKSRAVGEQENKFVGAWNLSGSITGTAGIVNAKRRAVKRIFRKHLSHYKLWFINEWMIKSLAWINNHVRTISVYKPLKDIFDLQKGEPTDEPLRTLLNDETLHSKTISPEAYATCFSWINAVCKADGESAEKVMNLLTSLFNRHGFEFRVTLTAENPRTLILISNISYARNNEAIKKAEEFCRLCSQELISNGFYPYRSGSGMYDKLPVHSDAYLSILKRLKHCFDPKEILAPGKYNI